MSATTTASTESADYVNPELRLEDADDEEDDEKVGSNSSEDERAHAASASAASEQVVCADLCAGGS